MATNPNGSPTMKATKNPGKLNTSFWNTAFKEDTKKPEKKPAPRKKRIKKKSKMANMWENKVEKEKKEVVAKSYNKTNTAPKKKIIKEADTNNNKTEDTDINTTDKSQASSTWNTNDIKPKPKAASKISAMAGKLKINPMGMRGGLPPSLRKKREEEKEKGVELPEQDFGRPLIPDSVRRKPKKRTLDIISITNKEINERLMEYLSISFQFDEKMILNENILCGYLKDIAGIDLSSTEDVNKWETDILISATKEVFGDTVKHHYGYQLRAI